MSATLAPPRNVARPPEAPMRGQGVVLPAVATAVAVLLAAFSLSPVFAHGAWFGAVLSAVVAVVAVGAVATWLRAPVFLVPVLQAVALFCALVARFTPDAPLGFFPSSDALASLRLVLADGLGDIDTYAPPIPVTEGATAVAALGLGCLAIVVFVLQVSLRMPVLAGLAVVSVYVVPSLVLDDGSPWWAFAFVAVAFMVLLVSDERLGLAAWGRMLRRSEGEARSPLAGFSSSALRLGTVAIVVAVAVPILVPALTDAVFLRHDTGQGTGGDGDPSRAATTGFDPLVTLRKQLTVQSDAILLTYRSDAAKADYLRTVVLTSYSGESWRPAAFETSTATTVDAGVPPDSLLAAPIVGRAATATTTVTSVGLQAGFLPVPPYLTRLAVDGGAWFLDTSTRTVFAESAATTTRGRTWTATSLAFAPTDAELRAAAPDSGSDITDKLRRAQIPRTLYDLAIEKTRGAGSDFDRAVALERWFHQDFTYSLTTASSDDPQAPSYLDQFIASKTGYCQQFAATMALMAESLGIPARVVVGFTPGQRQPDGTYVVRGKNAHAWPELYFTGVGWQRFEPTPSSAPAGVIDPGYTVVGPGPVGVSPSASASASNGVKPIKDERDPGGTAFDTATDAPASADSWRLRGLVVLAVLALLLTAVPALWRVARRRRRLSEQAAVEDMWEELRDTARDLGLAWSAAQTPRQAVASVVASGHLRGEDRDAAERVGRATERARYAPTAPSTMGLADDVSRVRRALLRRAERAARLRATLLPASLRDTGRPD
jgi:transglutaminase-like putative cysteine protease